MYMFRRFISPITYFVLAGFIALTFTAPTQAAMISTETVINASQNQQARDQLRASLNREEVKQQLLARGVDPEQLQGRVDALTDMEVQQLAAGMDKQPAGGDALAIAAFVFLALLLTDILGYTDIFPFVKKTAR
jgi:hypothetical protein